MSDPYKVNPLPPTDGIKDPQTRAFADALISAWGVRNGTVGANDKERFITKKEFQSLTESSLANIFAGGSGTSTSITGDGATNSPLVISNAKLIENLTNSILKSKLFIDLGTQIRVTSLSQAQIAAGAGLTTEKTIRASKDNAMASAINTMWAAVGNGGALIQDAQLAAATPVAALATKWLQVQAALTDPNTGLVSSAVIRSTYEAYVNDVNGQMNASYIVQAQISTGGRTLVGGFGLMATAGAGSPQGPTIAFGVRADTFFIAGTADSLSLPEQLANTAVPFIVVTNTQTIDGLVYEPGVYIKSAFFVKASIDKAFIKKGTITSAEIEDAAITTLKIAGEAITVPVSNYNGGGYHVTNVAQTVINLGSKNFGTFPTRINVLGMVNVYATSFGGDSEFQAQILMDGVPLGGSYAYSFKDGFGGTCMASADTPSPVTGSHSFDLQIRQSVGGNVYDTGPTTLTALGIRSTT